MSALSGVRDTSQVQAGLTYKLRSNTSGAHGGGWLPMPAFILFFMMLFVPTAYQLAKSILLAFILIAVVLSALTRRRLELHRTILAWTSLMVATGFLFMFIGWLHSTPGAWRVGTVYVLWPVVYLILITSAVSEAVIDGLFKVLAAAAISIGVYSLSFVLHSTGLLPDAYYIELDQGQQFGNYVGYMRYNLYSTASLMFLIPFLIAALMTWPRKSRPPVGRLWLWLALILTVPPAILTGRRALLVLLCVSPLVALGFRTFNKKERKSANKKAVVLVLASALLIGVALFAYLRTVFDLNISDIGAYVIQGFSPSADIDARIRKDQFDVLWQGWTQSPIWGSGFGATAGGYVRDPEFPWAYELTYMALLFHTGILGLCIYSAGIVWIFKKGIAILRSGDRLGLYMFPLLVGMACFLIANASNPYLEKFDCMWVIFLPVTVINIWLLRGEKKKHPAASHATLPINQHRPFQFRTRKA